MELRGVISNFEWVMILEKEQTIGKYIYNDCLIFTSSFIALYMHSL